MLPREFDAIFALEHKAVAQVVLEILQQTIGRVGDGQDGPNIVRLSFGATAGASPYKRLCRKRVLSAK
jgi:hypothetical protein